MDAKELRQKTQVELEALVNECKADLHDAEFRVASHQSGNVSELRRLKRDLARTLTILNALKSTSHV